MTDTQNAGGAATTGTTVLVGKLFRVRKGRGKRFEKEPPKEPEQRPARIAIQLALAYRVQRAIEAGEVRDQAEAARKLGVTRARVSQLLDLTLLAPVIQEQLLLPEPGGGIGARTERTYRPTAGVLEWREQAAVMTPDECRLTETPRHGRLPRR